MADDIPQWAMDRAREFTYATSPVSWHETFARYIAEHEEPPVDPLLVEARNIAADHRIEHDAFAVATRNGLYDDHPTVRAALAALRRGIELAKAQP